MIRVIMPGGEAFKIHNAPERVNPGGFWWIPKGAYKGFYEADIYKPFEENRATLVSNMPHVFLYPVDAPEWLEGIDPAPYNDDHDLRLVYQTVEMKTPVARAFQHPTLERWSGWIHAGDHLSRPGYVHEVEIEDVCDMYSFGLDEARFQCRYVNGTEWAETEAKEADDDDSGDKDEGNDDKSETPDETAPSIEDNPFEGETKPLGEMTRKELIAAARIAGVEGPVSQMTKEDLIQEIEGVGHA